MSARRHIGNPEVRARSGPESRRGRAHRKRRHVGRDEQPVTSAARKAGSGQREEGAERRAWGGAGLGPTSEVPTGARRALPQRPTGHRCLRLGGAKYIKTQPLPSKSLQTRSDTCKRSKNKRPPETWKEMKGPITPESGYPRPSRRCKGSKIGPCLCSPLPSLPLCICSSLVDTLPPSPVLLDPYQRSTRPTKRTTKSLQ